MALVLNGSNDMITGLQINSANIVNGSIASEDLATGVGGKVLQVVTATKTNTLSETLASGAISSAITGLTVSITPSSSSNKILLLCTLTISSYDMSFLFYKDSSVISGATGNADGTKKRVFGEQYLGSGYTMFSSTFQYVDTAGGTSAITYGPRVQNTTSSSRTYYVNVKATEGVSNLNIVGASTFTAVEVAA